MIEAPRLWRAIVRWLDPDDAEQVLRDLHEEAAQIAVSDGERAARRWMRWQLLHSLPPLATRRVQRARGAARAARLGSARGWFADTRHAVRRLRRAPGFAAMAVLILALGTGATGAVFSLAYGIWLKPLPFRAPDELVVLQEAHPSAGAFASLSGPALADVRAGMHTVSHIAAYTYAAQIARVNGERVRIAADNVSPNLFDVLGVTPIIGRAFTQADANQRVAILSYATWVTRFGRNPRVLAEQVLLSNEPYSIIGVMPPDFRFPDILSSELWTASSFGDWTDRSERFLQTVARLAPASTLADAQTEATSIASRLAQAYPATNRDWTIQVHAYDQRREAGYGAVFGSLLGLVGLFLVVSCTNLASLLIARNMDRRGELAVCASLGASRWRLARQLALEAAVLAVAGSAGGLALCSTMSRSLVAAMPRSLTGTADVRVDGTVIAFSCGIALVTAIICSVLPALSANRISATEALTGARRSGPRSQGLHATLVVVEVASALILIAGASVMAKSFTALLERDRGFNPHGVYALNVSLPFEDDAYQDGARRAEALAAVVERVARLPGVTHAGATNGFPGSALGILGGAILSSRGPNPEDVSAALRSATPDYFAAMDVSLKAGRFFTANDTRLSAPVAIVNETLARKVWPDQSPRTGLAAPGDHGQTTRGPARRRRGRRHASGSKESA